MKIDLNIERIVLDGSDFTSLRPEDIRLAIASELNDRLTNNRFKRNASFSTDQVAAPPVRSQQLATDVASSIHSIL